MATHARDAAILALTHDSEAVPDSIEIVREKHQGDDAVFAATFQKPSGRLVRSMIGLRRSEASGWRARGSWSSGPRDVSTDDIWLASGGWGSGGQPLRPPPGHDEAPTSTRRVRGVTGGWINEPHARKIRITDPNGRALEDTIEAGVAILIWEDDFDASGAIAELIDENGQVIRTGPMRTRR